MRPFEFVLLLVIALTLCVYVIDKRRRPRWIGICAPVMLLIGGSLLSAKEKITKETEAFCSAVRAYR